MTPTRIFTRLVRLWVVLLVVVLRPPHVEPCATSGSCGAQLTSGGKSPDSADVALAMSPPQPAGLELKGIQHSDETTCLPAAPLFAGLQRLGVPFVLFRTGRAVEGPLARELEGFPSRLMGRYPPARAPPSRSVHS